MVTLAACGFSFGGAAGGFVAAGFIEGFGWQAVFLAGGVTPLLLFPFLVWLLPESLPGWRDRGWRPVVFAVHGTALIPHEVFGPEDLVRGAHGVWEPRPSGREAPVADLEVILVPGLGFDPANGGRLGRCFIQRRYRFQLHQNPRRSGHGAPRPGIGGGSADRPQRNRFCTGQGDAAAGAGIY